MRETIRRICELQPHYSPDNTPEMQERGRLVRQVLAQEIRDLARPLGRALGRFGHDFHVDASDGIGRKTELPWVRFSSKSMSPRPTDGFYSVIHFSTDGSAVHITVGCSSSRFKEGYSIVLPPEQIDARTAWARQIVIEQFGTLEPFSDPIGFGASRPLPKSFERATALAKSIAVGDLDEGEIVDYLVQAAERLSVIYAAQWDGRELSPADQVELEIIDVARPAANAARGQGFGLTAAERRAVEVRAMSLASDWLHAEGYRPTDTSASKPYDFEATRDGETLYVEVKGTTSDSADAIAMTHGEVALHQQKKGNTALIIVTGIRLDRSTTEPSATGGKLDAFVGWDIDSWVLKPTAYRVSKA